MRRSRVRNLSGAVFINKNKEITVDHFTPLTPPGEDSGQAESRGNSGMEQIPYLVIAADGVGDATSRIDREALFEMAAAADRALGVHLILTAQSRSLIPDDIDRNLSLSISMTDGMWIARTSEGPESFKFHAYDMHAPVALLAGEEASVKNFLIGRISRVGKNCS